MKFIKLDIKNFRGIANLHIETDADVVVVAGPNGCGKSSIFDAIRLLKTAYGGYHPNEMQSFFSEFQLSFDKLEHSTTLLQDKSQPLSIKAVLTLSEGEKQWMKDNIQNLAAKAIQHLTPFDGMNPGTHTRPIASRLNLQDEATKKKIAEDVEIFPNGIASDSFEAEVIIFPDGQIGFNDSPILEYLFGTYEPQNLGIIDFHGAQRTYGREQLGGINLNNENTLGQMRQSALYNYQNKYSNVKSELASGYVRDLIAQASGYSIGNNSLLETMKELFDTFFPGKEFLGPQPTSNGKVTFNVRLSNGILHDIDDLSSGEKEVLYGYLRLRNSAPRNSVLLIDEPELHLNPRLVEGLPDFYHRHIGKAFNNQIWLITHSDSILRQAVGNRSFKVFHMQPSPLLQLGANQAQEIKASDELEKAIIDLVGDLAVYRPGSKVVVLEGGGDSEFDARVVTNLFPEFQSNANLISGGSKGRVKELFNLLKETKRRNIIPFEVFCVVDKDFNDTFQSEDSKMLSWDRFHIENYLLETEYILSVMRTLNIKDSVTLTSKDILNSLRECARLTMPSLVRFQLQKEADALLIKAIKTDIDPKSTNIASSLRTVIESSSERIAKIVKDELSLNKLQELESQFLTQYEDDLLSDKWIHTFRGRDILRRFCSEEMEGVVKYEVLRDLILGKMRDDNFEPSGMRKVIDQIKL